MPTLTHMTENIKKKIDNRQYANLQILNKLRDYFLAHPDMRFGQALANLNIIEYYIMRMNEMQNVELRYELDPTYTQEAAIL